MVTIHLAYTAPVNPAGVTPALTQAQVFAGMRRKVRHGNEFVPVIESCHVIKEEGNVITRKVKFVPGGGPGTVTEVCTELAPSRVDFFQQENGSRIQNIVAAGPSGEEHDLFMTYTFAWKRDDLEEGTEELDEAAKDYKKTAKMAVDKTIEVTRKLVAEGII